MDFETVTPIVSKPKRDLSVLYVCRVCAWERLLDPRDPSGVGRLEVGMATLNEVESITIMNSCPDCWEE